MDENKRDEADESEKQEETLNQEDFQKNNLSEKQSDENKYDNLINQYKKVQGKDSSGKSEETLSTVELLRQAEKNWGMQFSGSTIENATFVVHNAVPCNSVEKEKKKNLLGIVDEAELLSWCSEHYQDLYFSMLLAICILDRQPYQTVYHMAKELQKIFVEASVDRKEENPNAIWIFKTDILEFLGIVGYTDIVSIRGTRQEVDFLRLPVHEQAEKYVQLMVSEFPELKYTLTQYLIEKIIRVCGSRHDYMIVSGCTEALTFIAASDLQFFDEYIIPFFMKEKTAEMDFCLAVLLGKLYRKGSCRSFIETCVIQWAKLKNNPHGSLIALYVCGLLGKQETLVRDIWINILDRVTNELLVGNPSDKMLYFNRLSDFFQSGNRNFSYYKGVIHAFDIQIKKAEEDRSYECWNLLVTIFLLFLIDDYYNCVVCVDKAKRRDMIWIRIFKKLDGRTGSMLVKLWCLVLDSRKAPKEGWRLLESYLAEYKDYDEHDVESLAFFFYHINREFGRNQGLRFLKVCSEKKPYPIKLAGLIYKRIEE